MVLVTEALEKISLGEYLKAHNIKERATPPSFNSYLKQVNDKKEAVKLYNEGYAQWRERISEILSKDSNVLDELETVQNDYRTYYRIKSLKMIERRVYDNTAKTLFSNKYIDTTGDTVLFVISSIFNESDYQLPENLKNDIIKKMTEFWVEHSSFDQPLLQRQCEYGNMHISSGGNRNYSLVLYVTKNSPISQAADLYFDPLL